MVVAQHTMGAMPIELGSVGVGLFFALSGYLITSLLLDEYAARGTVAVSRFYLRRAARLVPALLLVVVVCDALFVIANDTVQLRGSLSALTYTANYAEILRGDFVGGYGPTWTLAVEEHFYLLWPLALLWVIRRYDLRTALRATLAVCLAALLWRGALGLMHVRYSLLAIGSLERADALLYGCAAAIAIRVGWRPHRSVVWLGLSVVAATPFLLRETYRGLIIGDAALAIAAAAVVVGLDYAAPLWLRRCLSLRAVVTVGVLSYGIYLWHGPAMRIAADFGYSGRGWRAVVVPLTFLAAGVSHRYLEAPVRSWARSRGNPVPSRRNKSSPGEAVEASVPPVTKSA